MAIVERPPARSPGLTYQELLDTDTHEVPDVLRLESPRDFGTDDLPVGRYTSRAYHEAEVELLWKRVWQFACREEELPQVGDRMVYDIAGMSYVLVRVAPDRIKAYVNACLHRGRQLVDHPGRSGELRCPFHGFAWDLDGSLLRVPAEWDFPHVGGPEWELPEAQVGTWAGFVFLNPDVHAAPLADHLGGLPAQFERWDLASRFIQVHVAKVLRCNWKVAQEAFCEAFHVNATHAQTLPYLGDTNSQVDIWDTFARVVTPSGTPSPLLPEAPTEEEVLRALLDVRVDEASPMPVPDGRTAREVAASASRDRWRPVVGDTIDGWSDAELVDNLDYTLFPNFHPWGGYNRITYRFRPNGDDHRSSIMEIYLLAPFAGERPPPSPVQLLGADDSFTEAEGLGLLGKVFDQDGGNMEAVQRGLETTAKAGVTLSRYQESKIRWLHACLTEWVGH